MKRCCREDGLTATQLAVVMPAVILWIMLIVQYGLWFHAKQVSAAAAAEAVDAAQVPGGTAADGERAAREFLALSGNRNLTDVTIVVTPTADTVTVRVGGQAPRLVPGMSWRVASVAESPRERFVPQPQR